MRRRYASGSDHGKSPCFHRSGQGAWLTYEKTESGKALPVYGQVSFWQHACLYRSSSAADRNSTGPMVSRRSLPGAGRLSRMSMPTHPPPKVLIPCSTGRLTSIRFALLQERFSHGSSLRIIIIITGSGMRGPMCLSTGSAMTSGTWMTDWAA